MKLPPELKKITWYSKLLALVVFIGVIAIVFLIGRGYEAATQTPTKRIIKYEHKDRYQASYNTDNGVIGTWRIAPNGMMSNEITFDEDTFIINGFFYPDPHEGGEKNPWYITGTWKINDDNIVVLDYETEVALDDPGYFEIQKDAHGTYFIWNEGKVYKGEYKY